MSDEDAARIERRKKLEAKERREKKAKEEEEKKAKEEGTRVEKEYTTERRKVSGVVTAASGLQHAVDMFMKTKRRVGGVKAKAAVAKSVAFEGGEGVKGGIELENEDEGGHEEQLDGAMHALQVALVDHDVEALLKGAAKTVQAEVGGATKELTNERAKSSPGRERRKTRQERLVAWTPSPEKKVRLGSMYRGVPVNAKPETILETKFTALKSDAVLLQNIQRDHGMNVSYRRKTSKPSDANTRRLLDFVKEKNTEVEKKWRGTKEGKKELKRVKSKKSLKELALAEM
ncbi:hypothetical protein TrCOL_g11723 [Triparma columacea]|uniref:Uncharacterized protein n=1 Tax=Triparma columacea TaxID=722753 RepID=A0A9W7G8C2_9STRA|nr:hypothetical protein TrCOL_g11723 [Triparma columacea]